MISQDFLKATAHERGLSKSEQEVLHLAMEGMSTSAIAQKLNISGDAVRKRLSEVYQKFEIPGRGPVKLTKLQQLLVNQYQKQRQLGIEVNSSLSKEKIAPKPRPYDFTEAPDVSVFYGRSEELATLQTWIVEEKCRLVALLGMSGIGKTALSVKLAKQLQDKFDYVLWRSLRQAPPLSDLLRILIRFFNLQPETLLSKPIDRQITALIEHFRSSRCLVILDGVENILRHGEFAGTYQEGYEQYGELFKRIGQEPHSSCLMLTSQEQLSEVSLLEGETYPVRSLTLGGLGEAAKLLLKEKGLSGEKNWEQLIKGYRGNPLMLKLVATTIKEIFDGNVTDFLKTTLFTRDISDFVEAILERLSDLEKQIVVSMGVEEKPISIRGLQQKVPNVPASDLIGALTSLRQRSLINKSEEGFTLPPVVRAAIAQ